MEWGVGPENSTDAPSPVTLPGQGKARIWSGSAAEHFAVQPFGHPHLCPHRSEAGASVPLPCLPSWARLQDAPQNRDPDTFRSKNRLWSRVSKP